MPNPYISRGPVHEPTMFFGRVHELQEIAAFLNGNQSVSIIGPRKMGKTSLLFHLQRASAWAAIGLTDKNLFVYLDCEILGEGRHEDIFGQFATEMKAALEERGLPPEPALETAIAKPARMSFEGALRKLNQRGLRVALILDEFERLSTNTQLDVNFFNALRSAAGRYQLVFLTASARPLIELTYSGKAQEILSSPFFNIFAPVFLGLLTEAEAQPLMRAAQPFPAATEAFIYRLVGGHPLALQIACFHALDVPTDTAEIERRVMRELQAHYEYYWRNLTALEQAEMRQAPIPLSRESSDTSLRGLLRDLTQKCLLILSEGMYRYPSLAWANFVAAQNSSTSSRGGVTPPLPGDFTGKQFGVYQILQLLGRGGMAEVYKGYHPRLDRAVAIKVLPISLAAESDFRVRFEREARAVAALKHPHIVQIYDFGDSDGLYYMVMEYLSGFDLARLLRDSGPLPLARALPLLQGIASALDYAHGQGLVHRDVKPSNVMLEAIDATSPPTMRAVLTDFGIAKLVAGQTGATRTGMVGTMDYMAPEQIHSAGDVDGRADLYALGIMAFQMLTGRVPFTGDHPGAVLMAHLQQPAPDARIYLPHLPASVALALQRALAKDPMERQHTAGEFIAALSQDSALKL